MAVVRRFAAETAAERALVTLLKLERQFLNDFSLARA